MFNAALFTITKKCEQRKCPLMDEWIKKIWYRSFHPGSVVTNLTSNHENVGLIPGLAHWVKDLVLP